MEVCYFNTNYTAVIANHSRVGIPSTQTFLAIYSGFTSAPTGGLTALHFFKNTRELRFIVLKRKGGPQQGPHSYAEQIKLHYIQGSQLSKRSFFYKEVSFLFQVI